MSASENTSWTITVSRDTDIAVRRLLARRGVSQGHLSEFIEEAVRWRVFDQTLEETRAGFADLAPDALQDLIDEAASAVRDKMRGPSVAKSSSTKS